MGRHQNSLNIINIPRVSDNLNDHLTTQVEYTTMSKKHLTKLSC